VHFAPERDSFLLAVAKALPVLFFPMPPLDAHGNRAEWARPEAAHFAGDAGEYLFSSFPLFSFSIWGFGAVGSWDEQGFLFFDINQKRSKT
jgi:hypothetical protein